jgi:hypothetical protein
LSNELLLLIRLHHIDLAAGQRDTGTGCANCLWNIAPCLWKADPGLHLSCARSRSDALVNQDCAAARSQRGWDVNATGYIIHRAKRRAIFDPSHWIGWSQVRRARIYTLAVTIEGVLHYKWCACCDTVSHRIDGLEQSGTWCLTLQVLYERPRVRAVGDTLSVIRQHWAGCLTRKVQRPSVVRARIISGCRAKPCSIPELVQASTWCAYHCGVVIDIWTIQVAGQGCSVQESIRWARAACAAVVVDVVLGTWALEKLVIIHTAEWRTYVGHWR